MPVVGWPKQQSPDIERHEHTGIQDGGDLDHYLRLDRSATQTITGPITLSDTLTAQSIDAQDVSADGVSGGNVSVLDGGSLIVQDDDLSLRVKLPTGALSAGREQHWRDEDGDVLTSVSTEVTTAVKIARNYRQTAQTAAIASFNLLTAPAAGAYEITAYIETTALTVGGTYTIPIGYTDAVGATSANVIDAIAVAGTGRTRSPAPLQIEVASGNVTAQVDVGLLTGTFNVRIIAKKLP